MGYLIPVTPQAFVNRISIFGPDEANIKGMRLLIILHLTIPINIFTPPKSLELYIQLISYYIVLPSCELGCIGDMELLIC